LQVAHTLSQSSSSWQEVNIGFWPNRVSPSHIRLNFNSGTKKEIIAKLPVDHAATLALVNYHLLIG
jgi:hypothetical protein